MAALPEPWKSLSSRIYKIEETLKGLLNRSPFFGTGMHANGAGGIDSDNFEADTAGWRLAETPEFNDLKLRGGIVGNGALTNPVVPAVAHADAVDFTVPTTANATRATATIPVPDGYTRAMVTAHAHASCFNPNAGADYLFVVAWIQDDTTRGWGMPVTIGPNESATTSQTATALLTGLSGSFTVKVALSSVNAAFTTSTSGNVCNIDATVLFLR